MNDYERIAKIIRHLTEHVTEQPNLTSLAELAGLSPFHFHRLFTRWAGVTPKDFLQCLTVSRVKEALQNGSSVLNAAIDSGLSGPGRLHDLCVTLEAASPGELKSAGNGWTLQAGFAETPFGNCLLGEGPRGICHLCFVEESGEEAEQQRLRSIWKNALIRFNDAWARKRVAEIFAEPEKRETPSLRLFVRGTEFQIRVWRALLEIPPGRLTSYRNLAATIGKPSAARAVGSAVGANEISYLIPCHRVIRETGVIGEYRWGTWRKRTMVARELCNASNGSSNPELQETLKF